MSKADWLAVIFALAAQGTHAGTVADLAAAQQELMRAEVNAKIKEANRKADGPAPGLPSLPPLPSASLPIQARGGSATQSDDPQLVEIFGVDAALIAGILVNGVVKHVSLQNPDLPSGWRVVGIDQTHVTLAKGKTRKEIALSASPSSSVGAGIGSLPPVPGQNLPR